MTPEPQPTVGRIVHFADGDYSPAAAIVTNVYPGPEGAVDLAIIRSQGIDFLRQVEHQPYRDDLMIGFWSYPPRV